MIRGKLENGRLIICPRNGYVDGIAVSNLPVYLDQHPDIAKKEGWLVINYLEEVVDSDTTLIERDGELFEVPVQGEN